MSTRGEYGVFNIFGYAPEGHELWQVWGSLYAPYFRNGDCLIVEPWHAVVPGHQIDEYRIDRPGYWIVADHTPVKPRYEMCFVKHYWPADGKTLPRDLAIIGHASYRADRMLESRFGSEIPRPYGRVRLILPDRKYGSALAERDADAAAGPDLRLVKSRRRRKAKATAD